MQQESPGVKLSKRFALTRYFSIASLICIIVVAALLGWSYQRLALRDLTNLAEARNVALTHAFSNSLWPRFSNLVASSETSPDALRSIAQNNGLYNLAIIQMKGTEAVKLKIYGLNGITVFSSDPTQTGENKSDNPGFRAGLARRVTSSLSHRNTFDAFEGTLTDLDVFSTYLPILDDQKQIVAVFEIYSDVTDLISQLNHTRLIVIGIVLGLLGLLYALLYILVARAQRIIDRQQILLEQSVQELDRRVQERTESLNVVNLRLLNEIEERKAAEEKIKNLAFYDPLTGLPNRRLLLDRLKQTIASSARSARHGALLFIDLDSFKTLNDNLGHDIGDLLLQQVGQRLAACMREGDTVARLGGDEFVVMLKDLSENSQDAATQTETVGEKILVTLSQPYQLTNYEHHSTASIGITLFTGDDVAIEDLLKRADLAMYQAKAAGRNTLRFFDPEMQAAVATRAELEVGLREAIEKDQLLLYYQVQVDGDGRLTGAEALLRWKHPQRGLVSPLEFIPLAEDTGLILPIGQWVLETACAQLALWATRPEMAHLTVAVNVSARQFHHPDFVGQVLAVLDGTGANPQRLKLELTESLLVDDVEDIIAKMTALKVQGVGFSLDDFGTGYSSLSYLKRLPLDLLKIDQSFVRDILTDPNDAAIAKIIVALAESLGLTVIAEGVEVEAQREFLARQGCHAYQGYLFSRPLPLREFEEFVQRI
jgi:diguanylate cyclase (GGDEF)-like protein